MTRYFRPFVALLAGASIVAMAAVAAQAEEGKLRIAEQFGVVYLLLNVAKDQQLIEKHGKEQGVDIDVEFLQLSGGASVRRQRRLLLCRCEILFCGTIL